MCALIQLEHIQIIYPLIPGNSQGQISRGADSAGDCQMSHIYQDPHLAASPHPAWPDPAVSARHEPQRAEDPSAPTVSPHPVLCRVLGSCGRVESVGREGWRRRGEQIAEGQERKEKNRGFSQRLHPPNAQHKPKGIDPALPVSASRGGRTCAVSLAGWL